jgi:hypothetical protein
MEAIMQRKLSFLSILLFSFVTNLSFSKISISGSSVIELKNAIAEFESILPENQFVEEFEPKLGFADVYLKRVGDKYDEFVDVLKANQRLLKLTALVSAFVYGKYINPEFFPNLIESTTTTAMKYLSIFMDSLLKGALSGVWKNQGVIGRGVAVLMTYSIINNVFKIGISSTGMLFNSLGKTFGEKTGASAHDYLKTKFKKNDDEDDDQEDEQYNQ